MKSAYELAMERLNKTTPTAKRIADLESKCKAKIAEREIALKDEITTAASAGDFEKVDALQQQLVNERKKLQAELEDKKEQIHKGGGK